jgi:hypothetical protein
MIPARTGLTFDRRRRGMMGCVLGAAIYFFAGWASVSVPWLPATLPITCLPPP